MFHRTSDAMRTKHPPSPLRKGETKVSTSILSPIKNKPPQKQAKRRLHHHPPHKFRHLVEKREEIFAVSREEEKAV